MNNDEVLKLAEAIKEQGRHISSLRSGYGTSDAIQSLDELVEMLVAKLREKDAATIAQLRAREALTAEYLEKIACLGNGGAHGNSIGNMLAIEALSASWEIVEEEIQALKHT